MTWEKVKLEDITSSITDGDHQSIPLAEMGVPFIIISDIKNNRIDFDNVRYVSHDYFELVDEKRKPKAGDVLLTVKGSFGIPAYVMEDRPFVFQRDVAIFKCNDRVNSMFLFYTFLNPSFYAYTDLIAIGSAQRALTLNTLRNTEISLPSIDIQNKIVSYLKPYDDLIENNQKQIKLLEEAAQRLYKEWFVDLHFLGYECVQIEDGIPEGWEMASINSRISILSGYAFKSSTFTDNGKYKIVTIKNVKDAEFDGGNVNYIDEIPSKMPDHCVLNEGDILLSLTGNVGRVCLVYGEDYLLNQRVAKLDSDTPGYTYCLFRSKEMFDDMNNLANGAAQQNLSPIRTGEIKVRFPGKDILQKFEQIVNPMVCRIIELNKMNIFAIEARDRLLPKLMSGEVEM